MQDGGVDKKPTVTVETLSLGYGDSGVGQPPIPSHKWPSQRLTRDRPKQKLDRHDGHHHAILGHAQSPSRDIGMMGVMIHVIGDAINNLGIIVASLFIWFMSSNTRYYADPAVSVGISLMIFMTALPLVKNSGVILLQGAPSKMDLGDVRHDIEKVCTIAYPAALYEFYF